MVRKATTDLEVSVAPIQCIKAFRKLVEQAGWDIERHEGARLVDRFAIIFPMAQSTRTIGIKVLDGPLRGLELACWSETRGSHGAINVASFLLPGGPPKTFSPSKGGVAPHSNAPPLPLGERKGK